jgi:ABC-type Fe3+ transport system permease subunit
MEGKCPRFVTAVQVEAVASATRRVDVMIEMHQGDEPSEEALGDDGDHETRRRVTKLARIATSPAAMAIGSLVIGLAALAGAHLADVIGETRLLGSDARRVSELTELRVIAIVQLVLAGIALVLAVLSGVRVREATDVDGEDVSRRDPEWVRGAAGAALIVSVISVTLAVVALVYALTTSARPSFGFAG